MCQVADEDLREAYDKLTKIMKKATTEAARKVQVNSGTLLQKETKDVMKKRRENESKNRKKWNRFGSTNRAFLQQNCLRYLLI